MTQKAFIYFSVNETTVTHSISMVAAKKLLKKHAYLESDISPDANPLTDCHGPIRIVLELVDKKFNNQVFYFFNELSPAEAQNFFKDALVHQT